MTTTAEQIIAKACTKCREQKPLDEFPNNVNSKDGKHCWCRVCQRASVKEWRANNAEKARAGYRRDSKVSRKHVRRYGIEPIDYELMLETQQGVCAICHGKCVQELAVDHDHVTGKVRALLCRDCNQCLGKFNDDPERFLAAAAYLVKHKEP